MKLNSLMIAVASFACVACAESTDELETNASPLMATPQVSAPATAVRPGAVAAPRAAAPPSLHIAPGTQQPAGAGCGGGLRGLSSEFPWAHNPDGGLWMGTGNEDPAPLRKYSDEEMLARALNTGDMSADRQHALVSVGRRKVKGAVQALDLALRPEQLLQVREMGLSGLMEHGGAEALPLMWRALRDDESSQIRGQAIWAIALYGADEAYSAIQAGLADENVEVQGMAVLAVWAIKDKPEQAFPILQAAIESDDRMLWQEGAYVLGRMPYGEALGVLESAARSAKDEEKRVTMAWTYRDWRQKFPDLCR